MEGRSTATNGVAVVLGNESGPLQSSGPGSSSQAELKLLQWGGDCFATPELVGQDHAHRMNIGVAIEFKASRLVAAFPADVSPEVHSPVIVVKAREAILAAQRQATVEPPQLSFHARAYEPT